MATKEAAKEKKEAAKKAANDKYVELEIPEDAHLNWQMYRSREQYHATPIEHEFKVGRIKGEAGDYLGYDAAQGKYVVLEAEQVERMQPITNTERAKS